jgi:hypothetical protein
MAITTLTILLALLLDVAALVPAVVALPAVGLVLLHVQAHLVRALRVITLQVGTTLLPDAAARAY